VSAGMHTVRRIQPCYTPDPRGTIPSNSTPRLHRSRSHTDSSSYTGRQAGGVLRTDPPNRGYCRLRCWRKAQSHSRHRRRSGRIGTARPSNTGCRRERARRNRRCCSIRWRGRTPRCSRTRLHNTPTDTVLRNHMECRFARAPSTFRGSQRCYKTRPMGMKERYRAERSRCGRRSATPSDIDHPIYTANRWASGVARRSAGCAPCYCRIL
jgi:hypothetical protein